MKKLLVAAAAASIGLVSASAAVTAQAQSTYQTPVTQAAEKIHETCMTSAGMDNPGFDSTEVCACVVGYMGGSMTDREFVLMGLLWEAFRQDMLGAGEAQTQLAFSQIYAAGFTDNDILAAMGKMESYGSRPDEVCAMFQREVLRTMG